MTAAQGLHRALLTVTDRGVTVPCGVRATAHLWTSDEAADRALAIPLCAGCPIGELCEAYADEIRASHGIWNGRDYTTQTIPKRKTA